MPLKPRILIVDDEPLNRKLLADLVTREGCEPVIATGGAQALAILAREPVHLVLLDLMMPDVDGMAVLAELHKQGALPALPVVVVTAHDDRSARIDALTAGAVDFITKPIDRLEVICKIRTLIELRRLRDQARDQAAQQATVDLYERLQQTLQELPLYLYRGTFRQDGLFHTEWVMGDVEGVTGIPLDAYLDSPSWFERIHPGDRGDVARVATELQGGTATSWRVRYRTQHPKRGDVWVLNVGTFDRARGLVMGATLDISAEKLLEERLVQALKMQALGNLAGGVAHDFNNILAVIMSYARFVQDELPEDDSRWADLGEVLKAADRAVGLTRQLLTFSRQQPTAKQPTDLNDSLVQIYKLLATSLGANIELSVAPAARPAIVRIDPVQFDQILLNLAVNARDAMPEGGRLDIAIDHPPEGVAGRRVRVTVADTGVGMEEQTRQRIFEPFFTTKDKGKGTGLGLATTFGIVEDAGGTVHVESAPGRGARFTIDLPWCGESVDPDRREATVPRVGHGETVLVAEDEPALRRVIARVLESAGYQVSVASDGNEAIRMIDRLGLRLDVIVSDVVMPGCSGYGVATHAARVAPRAAVILTSGYLDDTARRNQREDLPILWKPVPHRDLLAAVAAAVATRRPAESPAPAATVTGDLVLVVEDDAAVQRGFVRLLATAGYATTTAATVAEARQLLEAGLEPQLVLCDLSLPDGSGAEVVELIRRTRPALCPRVLILSGASDETAERLVASGAARRLLSKPIASKLLLEVLAEARQVARAPAPVIPARSRTLTLSPPPALDRGPAPRKERVLVVDDDDSLAAAAARILGNAGFDVVVVGTLAAAQIALASGDLDALVADVGLPDGDGFELLRDLRGGSSDLPVVMITGAPSIASATQAVRTRVHEYLTKPFGPDELLQVVRSAVDTGRISRLRTKLLAARFGGDEFVTDLPATEKRFALALPKIRMVFQPIVRSGDGSVFGYEALLRCDEPSLASPLRLLAAAEVLGRVNDVGRAVRASVAATIHEHSDRVEAIFVNLHPAELRADLLGELTDPLMPLARRVVLEVTERASLESGPKLDDDLARIRDLGYRLAVDDLGEGYAGLSSLVNLRPDIAKIDMSLVRDIHRAPLKRDIVAALVDMARRSGIVVVAEGIETVDERETLVDLGCDLLQGYLFAKPGPPFPVPRTRWDG